MTEKGRPRRPKGSRDKVPRKRPEPKGAADGTKPRRRPGRPRKHEAPVTPAVLTEMSQLWLDHVPLTQIAETFGISVHAVWHHVHTKIIPTWKATLISGATSTQIRLQHTAAIAFARWKEDREDSVAASMYKWAIEAEIRLLGLNAPTRLKVDERSTYRVAGVSKLELGERMLLRLAVKMDELKRQREIEGQSYLIQPATRANV
jgi:hypothetical protein